MPSKSNDPRWITARFMSECWADGCEKAIRKNEDIFYFPIGKESTAAVAYTPRR